MKRAFLIECSVLRQYVHRIVPLSVLVVLFVSIGMGTAGAVNMMVMMAFMLCVCSLSAYDDANGWGSFRLAMPVSRRDVVLARYAMEVVFVVGALVIAVAVSALVSWVGDLGVLPTGPASEGAEADSVGEIALSVAATAVIGSLIAGIYQPCLFKFGTTKVTQFLPFLLVFVVLAVSFGFTFGMKAVFGDAFGSWLIGLLTWMALPDNVWFAVAAMVGVSVVFFGVGLLVSLRIYDRRDL